MIKSVVAHLLQTLLPWLHVVLDVAGIVVALTYLKTTKWMILLLAGFTVAAVVGAVMNTAIPFLMRNNDPSSVSTLFSLISAVGLLAKGAIVAGLAGVLSVLMERSSKPSSTAGMAP